MPWRDDRGEIPELGYGVTVWDSDLVEGSVIPTRSPITRSLLGHHVEWGCPIAG